MSYTFLVVLSQASRPKPSAKDLNRLGESVKDWLIVQESAVSGECAITVDLVVVS